jgi:acetoacetate decarboxylase
VISAMHIVADLTLDRGEVVHDYLAARAQRGGR